MKLMAEILSDEMCKEYFTIEIININFSYVIREASMLSQRDGAYVSSYIEKQILASNYRDTDPRRNEMGATLAYPVPTAPPQFPESLPVPSYASAAPSYSGQGYDTTEYRIIYDLPSSNSSSSSAFSFSSGGYQCQEYKSIYDK